MSGLLWIRGPYILWKENVAYPKFLNLLIPFFQGYSCSWQPLGNRDRCRRYGIVQGAARGETSSDYVAKTCEQANGAEAAGIFASKSVCRSGRRATKREICITGWFFGYLLHP